MAEELFDDESEDDEGHNTPPIEVDTSGDDTEDGDSSELEIIDGRL